MTHHAHPNATRDVVQLLAEHGFDGMAQAMELLRKYAAEPLIEIRKLYQQLVFNWWCGNGDLHLKNFSLLTGEDGISRLTPAYDLVCTQLVIPDDPLALPVGGKKTKLRHLGDAEGTRE